MGTTALNSNHQALAQRAKALASTANQLIADIESDVAAPTEAAFHAKDAFMALNRAHNALLDAIAENRVRHYESMARDAGAAA
jgi:Holliday junction resolvasome RuvABC endonuclease subunit